MDHKIIQYDDTGELRIIDNSKKSDNNVIGMDNNTDLNAISQFVDDQVSQDVSYGNNDNVQHFANPFGGGSYNNGYNGYNNAYQPPSQPHPYQQYQPHPMPPMPSQQMNNNSGGFFDAWLGGGGNDNLSNSSSKKSKKGKRRSGKIRKYGNNTLYNDDGDDSGPKFKDVTEIFKNDGM